MPWSPIDASEYTSELRRSGLSGVTMRRREIIGLLGAALAACPIAAFAQQPKKIWRIGMLETIAAPLKTADYDAFLVGMEALGYAEARDFKIEYRSADGHPDRFPKLAQDLVSQNVDLITTRGTPAAFAAKNATKTIPVVMVAIGEPLLVVEGLARPGGNITGLSAFVTDLMGKRTELLRDMLPGLSWVGAILNMSNGSQPPNGPRFKRQPGSALRGEADIGGYSCHLNLSLTLSAAL